MGTIWLRAFMSPLVATLGVAFATSSASAGGGGNGNGNGGNGNGGNGAATPIDQLIMYGVDNDTDELIRYRFDTDEFMVMSALVDEDGNVVDKCEALGSIPHGPSRGLYAVSNYDGSERARLIKFNPFNDTVTVYPQDIGYGNIEGMVARQHPESGKWKLWAVQTGTIPEAGDGPGATHVMICHRPPGNPANTQTIVVGVAAVPAHLDHGDSIGDCGDGLTSKNLIEIDPQTGLGEMLMPLGEKFEGLAKGADDMLYATKGDALWTIDLHRGELAPLTSHGYNDVEALEFAFGDFALDIDVPGVPPAWTNEGALLGYTEQNSTLLIFSPFSGNAVEQPCSLTAFDLEGIVFFTEWTDPLGGVVAGFD